MYDEEGKASRLSAKLHVAICQEDHKVGKRSHQKNKDDNFACGEMFGASTGRRLVRGSDGIAYATVLKLDGSYLSERRVWDEAAGENRWAVYASNNVKNVKLVCHFLRFSN